MAKSLTLMAVHAHPDDESSSTGGVLARYGDEGVTTVVVTCTNGEMGDGPNHVKPGEEGHDANAVAKTRLGELEAAAEILGVTHVELLGYRDSGMADWEYQGHTDAFCNVPLDTGADRLLALFERYRPNVVITYANSGGGYNHPDHVHAHAITEAACERSDIPSKLYFIARRRGDWQKMRERLVALGMEFPVPQISEERLKAMAELEARITTTVDVRPHIDRKRAALAAHASQLDESWWSKIPDDVWSDMFGAESFIRARHHRCRGPRRRSLRRSALAQSHHVRRWQPRCVGRHPRDDLGDLFGPRRHGSARCFARRTAAVVGDTPGALFSWPFARGLSAADASKFERLRWSQRCDTQPSKLAMRVRSSSPALVR